MVPPFPVFIYYNGTFAVELAGTMDPHVTFTVRTAAVLNHLGQRFICLGSLGRGWGSIGIVQDFGWLVIVFSQLFFLFCFRPSFR